MSRGADYLDSLWQRRVRRLADRGQLRQLPEPVAAGLIDVSHNDYLRLIPELDQLSSPMAKASGGSRLLGGLHPVYRQLEAEFSAFKGSGESLLFNSGFVANEALIHCLNLPDTGFFYDELNHASIIDGMRLAHIPKARKWAFRHQDLNHLEQLLKASSFAANIVIVESVYSMDGHIADLDAIIQLCRRYRGIVVIDEAHALGVYGPNGAGFWSAEPAPDVITVNPCGKGLASLGAFVTGPKALKDYALNMARGFIYTTALPPYHCDILRQTLALVAGADQRRQHLHQLSASFRRLLDDAAIDHLGSTSHIFPIICSDSQQAVALSSLLASDGFYARPIRYPTVAKGHERVRVSLNAGLTQAQVSALAEAIARFFTI